MDRFGYVKLTLGQKDDADDLREAFRVMEAVITTITPAGREQALALTKLEESAMWAVKAIAVGRG